MQPEEPRNNQPVFIPAQPTPAIATPTKQSLKLPIILMVWQIPVIILAIILYGVINFISGGDSSTLKTITNVFLFLFGAAAVFFGPISFIVGLVLLIQRLAKN